MALMGMQSLLSASCSSSTVCLVCIILFIYLFYLFNNILSQWFFFFGSGGLGCGVTEGGGSVKSYGIGLFFVEFFF